MTLAVSEVIDFTSRFKDHDYDVSSSGLVRLSDAAASEFVRGDTDVHVAFRTVDNAFTFSQVASIFRRKEMDVSEIGWIARFGSMCVVGTLSDSPDRVASVVQKMVKECCAETCTSAGP